MTSVPEELTGNFSKALRFNADGSPVLLNGSQYNIGTVFQPGTVIRNAAGNIIGGHHIRGISFRNPVQPKRRRHSRVLQNGYRGLSNLPVLLASPTGSVFLFRTPISSTRTRRPCAWITTSVPRPTCFSAGWTTPSRRARASASSPATRFRCFRSTARNRARAGPGYGQCDFAEPDQ